MSFAAQLRPVPIEEYLDGESRAQRKHEYVEGVIYAMVGATNTHNLIATNVTGLLHSQLRGQACRVFNADANGGVDAKVAREVKADVIFIKKISIGL